jgi:phosphoribulokinase
MTSLMDRIIESGKVFIVGIAGDSGSGKTSISNGIRRILGEGVAVSFSMDDYHTLDRKQRKVLGVSPLNPKANNLGLLADHLEALKAGRQVQKPIYDHKDGSMGKVEPFGPAPVVIVEGLHPFYTERLRNLMDFKIFVDPSRQVKRLWKLRRDVDDRGYKQEEVMAEILQREPDYKLYVDIQKIYADAVVKIQGSRFNMLAWGNRPEGYSVRLIQRTVDHPVSKVDLTVDLGSILRNVDHEFFLEFQRDDYYGKKVDVMTIDGEIPQATIDGLERKLGGALGTYAVICDRRGGDHVDATGMAQLILTWRFVEHLEYLLVGK